jgi:hypothetical protein
MDSLITKLFQKTIKRKDSMDIMIQDMLLSISTKCRLNEEDTITLHSVKGE